jgi:hypothetical protein
VNPKSRHVKVFGGPHDGLTFETSLDSLFFENELYVQNGSEGGNEFVHAETAVKQLPGEHWPTDIYP